MAETSSKGAILGCSTANACCRRNGTASSCGFLSCIFLDFGVASERYGRRVRSTILRKRQRRSGVSFNAITTRCLFGCRNSAGGVYQRHRLLSCTFWTGMRHPGKTSEIRKGVAPSSARQCGLFSRQTLGDIWIMPCYGNSKSSRFPRRLAG